MSEMKIKLLGKFFLVFFLVSNDSVHLSRIEFLLLLYLIPVSDPDLWSVAEQIYGMHLNIESSTDKVIDGRHLIINQ